MKKILIVTVLFILASCTKDDDVTEIYNNTLAHAELGFELDEPNIILNELAFGKLDRNINSVLRQMFVNVPEPSEKYWGFDYKINSDRISKSSR